MVRHRVVLIALLCATGTALAQAPSAADAHADWQARHQQWEQKWQQERARMEERRMDRLAVLLDMTPAQKQQVQTILSAERGRVQQAMKQAMEARRAARTETVTKLGQVLSPAQMKKLKLLMPKRHRRFMMMGPGGMGMHGMHGSMGMPGPKGMWDHPSDEAAPPPPPPPPGQ
jgi:flagellar biosynthesis GTPase FlhF